MIIHICDYNLAQIWPEFLIFYGDTNDFSIGFFKKVIVLYLRLFA